MNLEELKKKRQVLDKSVDAALSDMNILRDPKLEKKGRPIMGETRGDLLQQASIGADQAGARAVRLGVTDGTGNGRPSPDKVCGCGQPATFLHRAYVPEARLTTR